MKQDHNELKTVLTNVFGLGEREQALTPDSNLINSIPEFDSMTVVTLITALEKHFRITIYDDEINAEIFETLDSLSCFIEQKLNK